MKYLFLFVLAGLPASSARAQIMTTIAGTNVAGYTGNNGPATNAQIYHPNQITLDAAGNVYIAETDNHVVRKISPAGIISLVAGNHTPGWSGDGGPATNARLDAPIAVRFDAGGNLYIPTAEDNRIRKVTPAGIISTIAGTGIAGAAGDGGLATAASFDGPFCIAFDAHNDMYIADLFNNRVRKIDMSTGIINTVAGTGTGGYLGDGGPATAALMDGPIDLAFDKAGNLYIAEIANSIIRKIGTDGNISTVAGTGSAGLSGDGGSAAAAELSYPYALCLDTAGNIYISDNANACIRKITAATGIISTVAGNHSPGYSGDGGPATAAQIENSGGVAVNMAGDIFIADFGNNVVRKVSNTPVSAGLTSPEPVLGIVPNPASKIVRLSYPTKMTSVEVIGIKGNVVAGFAPDAAFAELDISSLAPGTYLLRVNNAFVRSFVKH